MDLTVQEALQLEELKNARVLAGKRALGRVIKYVDTMEVPVSDMRPWLRANELLVTTAYVIKDDTRALKSLVEALVEVGAAGLMLKSARFIGTIPSSVIDAADAMGLPVVEVPKEVPLIDITHSILKEILDRQSRFLEYSNEVRHALTIVELEGTGLDSLASSVARLVGNDVAITDSWFNVLAWSSSESDVGKQKVQPQWLTLLEEKKETIGSIVTTAGRIGRDCAFDVACLVRPIIVKGKTLGYLFVREEGGMLGEMELIALEHASTTVALEMTKQQALAEVQRRMEIGFFDDLLMGNVRSPEVALQRAVSLGFPTMQPVALVVVSINDFDGLLQRRHGEFATQEIRDTLGETVRVVASRRSPRPIVILRSDSVVCILPLSSPAASASEGRGFGQEVMADIKRRMPDISVTVGVSYACVEPLQLPAAYREAIAAVDITRATDQKGTIGFIGDLEAYRLLYEHPDQSRVDQLVACLKPLLDHDQEHDTELYKTLFVTLARARSNDAAAKRLHIHRNTLTHRLKQIEEILSVDLSDPEQRFRLGLAVRAVPLPRRRIP